MDIIYTASMLRLWLHIITVFYIKTYSITHSLRKCDTQGISFVHFSCYLVVYGISFLDGGRNSELSSLLSMHPQNVQPPTIENTRHVSLLYSAVDVYFEVYLF